jgi:hypothetical protein
MSRSQLLASAFCISFVAAAGCGQSNPVGPTPTGATAATAQTQVLDTQVLDGDIGDGDGIEAQGGRPVKENGITIVKGTIVSQGRRASAFLRGTRGFLLEANLVEGIAPAEFCGAGSSCPPGRSVSLEGFWAGISVSGTVRLQGQTYTLGDVTSPCGIVVRLAGSFVAPPQADTATVTAPFTLAGQFGGCEGLGVLPLQGSGTATVSLIWDPHTEGWAVTGVTFDFGRGH